MKEIIVSTAKKCAKDNIVNLSAALAYYIIFAIAPIVYVIAWISSFFLDDALLTIINDLLLRLSTYLGSESIDQIRAIVERILFEPGNVSFNIFLFCFVVFFATSIFSAIRKSLNRIWNIDPDKYKIKTFFRNRLVSFLVLATMAFLVVSISVVNTLLGGLENYILNLFPGFDKAIGYLTSGAIEGSAAFILFFAILKLIPDFKIHNRDIIAGGLLTSLMFVLGKYVIGLLLSNSFYTSIYSAIGSIMIIILWFYYIALIFYLGAVFTASYSKLHGRHIKENNNS